MRSGASFPPARGAKRAVWRPELPTRRWLGLICLLILCVTLYAGLTPFRAPTNTVAWLPHLNGLQVGPFGTLRSVGVIPAPTSGNAARSLEIWMQPRLAEDSSTFLALYDPTRRFQLLFDQSISDLKIEIASSSAWRRLRARRFYVDDAFRERKSTFWTITVDREGTAVFRDGVIARQTREFRISGREFSGVLVIGTAPLFNLTWQGVVRGLAIYDRALPPDRVEHHYQTWTKQSEPDVAAEDRCIALYLFDEGAGRVVHDRIGTGADLEIPAKYLLTNPTVLDPVWTAVSGSWGFWKDALINTFGFMPVGFFFCAWFSAHGRNRSALMATALGAILSLFIELVQVHLPTRDSSMSDVITNIVGSAAGAAACNLALIRLTRRRFSSPLPAGSER